MKRDQHVDEHDEPQSGAPDRVSVPTRPTPSTESLSAREIGGQSGPEPTRYGDWEKNGRCTDF